MAISKSGRVTSIHREMRTEISSDKPQEDVISVSLSPAKQNKHYRLIDQPNLVLS